LSELTVHLVFLLFTNFININKSLLTSINKLGGQLTFPLAIYVPLIPEAGHLQSSDEHQTSASVVGLLPHACCM